MTAAPLGARRAFAAGPRGRCVRLRQLQAQASKVDAALHLLNSVKFILDEDPLGNDHLSLPTGRVRLLAPAAQVQGSSLLMVDVHGMGGEIPSLLKDLARPVSTQQTTRSSITNKQLLSSIAELDKYAHLAETSGQDSLPAQAESHEER